MGSVRETLKEQGLPAGGNVTFVQARTAHEIAKAHLARLRLQRMKGELVDRARATALVFRLAREERDAWINWPARVAALMAAELGVEAHPMQRFWRRMSARTSTSLPRSGSSYADVVDFDGGEELGTIAVATFKSETYRYCAYRCRPTKKSQRVQDAHRATCTCRTVPKPSG